MTRQGDDWNCEECGVPQGRHDQWFEGGLCGDCHVEPKKIYIGYWREEHTDKTGYANNEVMDYTEDNLFKVFKTVLDAGLNLMTQQRENGIIVYIDQKRFRQS